MSSELYMSEKTQNNECDSGFVSQACTSSFCNSCSMKVAQSSQNNDYVKDLQVDFAGINNFDDVPMEKSSTQNFGEQQQPQTPLYKQPMQYFQQNEDGDTQLHLCVYAQYTDIALWLIESVPHTSLLDLKNDDLLTALHVAVMTKQINIIRKLVLACADVTITTSRLYQPWSSRGNAAIHMACEADDFQAVTALTEPLSQEEQYWLAANRRVLPIMGRDLELRNYDGITPMHLAIRKGNLAIVKQLVKVGAEVNTVDLRSGLTSLHLAIHYNQRHIVEYMAKEHSSCLNVPTRYGTSTYEICLNCDKQLAENLMRWGVEPIVKESDSESENEESDPEGLEDESAFDFPTLSPYPDFYQGGITLITT